MATMWNSTDVVASQAEPPQNVWRKPPRQQVGVSRMHAVLTKTPPAKPAQRVYSVLRVLSLAAVSE